MLPTYFSPEQAASNYLSDNRDEAFAAAGFYMVNYVVCSFSVAKAVLL